MGGSEADQIAMRQFVTGLFELVASGQIWEAFGPIVILFLVIRVLLWAWYSFTGNREELDSIADSIDYRAGAIGRRLRGQDAGAPPPPRRYRR